MYILQIYTLYNFFYFAEFLMLAKFFEHLKFKTISDIKFLINTSFSVFLLSKTTAKYIVGSMSVKI